MIELYPNRILANKQRLGFMVKSFAHAKQLWGNAITRLAAAIGASAIADVDVDGSLEEK